MTDQDQTAGEWAERATLAQAKATHAGDEWPRGEA